MLKLVSVRAVYWQERGDSIHITIQDFPLDILRYSKQGDMFHRLVFFVFTLVISQSAVRLEWRSLRQNTALEWSGVVNNKINHNHKLLSTIN